MLIGIPKEKSSNESRVAATPMTVKKLINLGFSVYVESHAGKKANFNDQDYINSGANITNSQVIWQVDIILKINPPEDQEILLIKKGSILISFIWPSQNKSLITKLAAQEITVIAMDAVPRISRAQSLDALSSMSNIAGYRAIVEAAYEFDRFFGGQITAAGKVFPAKVLVIGAGVAGLAAISAAKNMGAIVKAFDNRIEVKEQIQSLGAEFLELDFPGKINSEDSRYTSIISKDFIEAEIKLFSYQSKESDIIITTALIPGRKAPILITEEMVLNMKKGSVIVDLAIQSGGNCSLTIIDQIITTNNGIKIIGYTDFASRLANQSSQLYATNVFNLIKLICKGNDGLVKLNFNDVVIRSITVIDNGKIIWPAPPVPVSEKSQVKNVNYKKYNKIENKSCDIYKYIFITLLSLLFIVLSDNFSREFLSHITIFMLSCIVGYCIVWNVNHALHTPLISVTNAISGIFIIGSILQTGINYLIDIIAFITILLCSINIFGGFYVTHRMLKMFRRG
ncbi:NAD(P)(+) transhydrogenase (Re/Si-specific) subunit alpha [Candidatus Pantoea edessiphila]|uniref:NAD(P) transhydrogenase subunit alpha n=1 Tax=Candidatus Pantoea edessiphila TaxID=2044610 RepID=A0A2P5SYQ5_9GAMM|nr:Re/Si-specific NAD(P)(+) transhydrogenase subunit alpha [Candidatus Pantoea edessiphila]MBK4775402.1 Re/Si-specific NAD(P)(+) transhydrogenase subunit alpha [Pantoea sp. Edef]PPI87468.1 NAD(P)(+) transhydrogenase (Re/Si-specific) subunit alpha [Candidatus Pantoea edessiphila]